MFPQTQPPQYVTSGNMPANFPNQPPPSAAVELGRIVLTVLPIFLSLQTHQPLEGTFQAEPIANPEKLNGDKTSDEGDSPLPPAENAQEGEQTVQFLAKLIANGVALDKFSFGKLDKKPSASDSKKTNEQGDSAVDSPSNDSTKINQETLKANKSEGETALNYSKLFDNLDLPLKLPKETSLDSTQTQMNQEAGKSSEKLDKKDNELNLNLHAWRQLKTPDLKFQPSFNQMPSENTSEVLQKPSADNKDDNKDQEKKNFVSANKSNDPNSKGNSLPVDESSKIHEAAKRRSSETNKETPIQNPIEIQKDLKPRTDIVLPLIERRDDIPQPAKFNIHFPIDQLPIASEQPFTRDGVLRYSSQNRNIKIKHNEGYRFGDMILMVFCAVLCGAQNSIEICRYLQAQEKFFKIWLGLKARIPPFRLFWFILNRLKPERLPLLIKNILTSKSSDLAVQVQMWESSRGLIFGELNSFIHQKLHLLSEVLSPFDLMGAAITIDAPVLLPEVYTQIKRESGEVMVILQEEHTPLYAEINSLFDKDPTDNRIEIYKHNLIEGDQIDIREVRVVRDMEFNEELHEINSAVKLFSESITHNKHSITTRCFLSTLKGNPERISKTLRILNVHESKAQWLADCDFLFDNIITEFETANIAMLQQLSAHLIAADLKASDSIDFIRKKASSDNQYLHKLITNFTTQDFEGVEL